MFVEVDLYEVFAAEAHAAELFGFRDEEVFHQAPVEEGALGGKGNDLKQDDIAEDAFGLLGGCDQPVFAVVINKNFEFVAGAGGWGGKTFWQEDAFAAIIEDEAHSELSFDDQFVVFADADHRAKVRIEWEKFGVGIRFGGRI